MSHTVTLYPADCYKNYMLHSPFFTETLTILLVTRRENASPHSL